MTSPPNAFFFGQPGTVLLIFSFLRGGPRPLERRFCFEVLFAVAIVCGSAGDSAAAVA